MSDRDDENSGGDGMDFFWLGNVGEGNRVDADYLDEVSSACTLKRFLDFF